MSALRGGAVLGSEEKRVILVREMEILSCGSIVSTST